MKRNCIMRFLACLMAACLLLSAAPASASGLPEDSSTEVLELAPIQRPDLPEGSEPQLPPDQLEQGAVPPALEPPAVSDIPVVPEDPVMPGILVETVPAAPTDDGASLYAANASVTGVYTTWQNAKVIPNGQTAAFSLSSYDSNLKNSQMWFAVNVERDHQAIKMDFRDVAKSTYVYIYDGAVLNTRGPTTSSNDRQELGRFTGNTIYSWKAAHSGTYYILLMPYNSSNIFTTPASLTVNLLDGDLNESNDTWDTAYELAQNVSTYYTLNGSNDVDWFKITTSVPGEAIKLIFSGFDYTVPSINAYLYAEGNTNSAVAEKTNFRTDGTLSYKVNVPGTYYVKIRPYSGSAFVEKPLRLRYEIVPGDQYELNDSYMTATPMPDDYDMEFTLNGQNDEDWFYFETTKENELVYLYFSGFEPDYSNKISYYVYDKTSTGYDSSNVDYANISITHSNSLTFANVGGHYIRIRLNGSTPVENTLRLRISRGIVDDGEPNDIWQQATALFLDREQKFNIPASTDTDWFRFTADDPNMTVALTVVLPAGGRVGITLYSGADLMRAGSNANGLEYWLSHTGGSRTYRYMLGDAGDYYIKLSPSAVFDMDGSVSYTLIEPDRHEGNNTWQAAAFLNERVADFYTMPAGNDVDWFKFEVNNPNMTVELNLVLPAGGRVGCALYSGATLVNSGNNADALEYWLSPTGGTARYRWMLSDAGYYYVKLSSSSIFDSDATITYSLIEPDGNERNNSWTTAKSMNAGIATSYTMPASNDEDWFKFTANEPNLTVQLDLALPAGGRVGCAIYSGAKLVNSGNNASALEYWLSPTGGTVTYRWMLAEAGDYYVKLSSSIIFDTNATITYSLIEPDGNERNNGYDVATPLSPQSVATFKLPSSNDEDWFKLNRVEVGDKIVVTVGNNSGIGVNCALYVLKPGAVSTTHVDGALGSTTYSRTWTASQEGDYFIRLNSGGWTDIPLTFKYAITRDAVQVNGVSITNGNSTIHVGTTLQLYANVTPANAANQNVTWTSSNTNVATIEADGLVTAKATGTTTITATTADGGYKATTTVRVEAAVPVTGVSLICGDPQPVYGAESNPKPLALGTGVQFTAVIAPENATNRSVTWTVSDPEVLQVTNYGKVSAVGSGKAKVIATTVDGNRTAEFWINVPDETYPVRSISLDRNNATLYMGEGGTKLKAKISPEYATNLAVSWSSDNPAVAKVDQNGLVTPVSTGYATITVQAEENSAIRATCRVSVQPVRIRVQSISFANDRIDVGLYGTVTLQPDFTPVNATDQTVTWTSSDQTVATVSRTGVVTAIGIGKTEITATTVDGEKAAKINIYVGSNAAVGDIDNNGRVDAGDALMVLRSSVGLIALTDAQRAVADVNGDNSIDAGDAILILRYNLGFIDSFPAEKK